MTGSAGRLRGRADFVSRGGERVRGRSGGWWEVALLLGLSLVYLGPSALLPQRGHGLVGLDLRALFIPWLEFARGQVLAGHLPTWDPYHFAGYPFSANPQGALFYPPTWIVLALPANVAVGWLTGLHIWLAGVGMLILTRRLGAARLPAMLAAISYAFSGFVSARIWAGHLGVVMGLGWLPWLLTAYLWSVERGAGWAAVAAGGVVGLDVLSSHSEFVLYSALIWLAFVIYVGVQGGRWGLAARQAIIMGAVGVGLGAVQLLPFAQLLAHSARLARGVYQYASRYSLPPAHLITLIVPEFFGEPTHAGYWSVENFEELTYYVGLLPLLGLGLGLHRPTRLTWLYVALGACGLLAAMGSYGFVHRDCCISLCFRCGPHAPRRERRSCLYLLRLRCWPRRGAACGLRRAMRPTRSARCGDGAQHWSSWQGQPRWEVWALSSRSIIPPIRADDCGTHWAAWPGRPYWRWSRWGWRAPGRARMGGGVAGWGLRWRAL
jgi:hypothetical protein